MPETAMPETAMPRSEGETEFLWMCRALTLSGTHGFKMNLLRASRRAAPRLPHRAKQSGPQTAVACSSAQPGPAPTLTRHSVPDRRDTARSLRSLIRSFASLRQALSGLRRRWSGEFPILLRLARHQSHRLKHGTRSTGRASVTQDTALGISRCGSHASNRTATLDRSRYRIRVRSLGASATIAIVHGMQGYPTRAASHAHRRRRTSYPVCTVMRQPRRASRAPPDRG